MSEDTLTLKEAENLYGIAADTLRRACWQGRLTARKSGGTWLVLRGDLEAWLGSSWAKRTEQSSSTGTTE